MVMDAVARDTVRKIVRTARPRTIVLFGSSARLGCRKGRDLDLLVIKDGSFDRDRLLSDIYMALLDSGRAADVILVTPEEARRYRNEGALIISTALTTGRVVYSA